jgi:hypothetical protein
MPAILGGLFIGVLSALPVVQLCNCCCLWVIGGGALAAYLQQQQRPVSLTAWEGARLGLLAGIVGACVWFVVDSALQPLQIQVVDRFLQNASDMPPEVQAWLETAKEGSTGGKLFEFVAMLIFGSALAAVGGVIGAVYFRKDVPPALGGPINPPPLP